MIVFIVVQSYSLNIIYEHLIICCVGLCSYVSRQFQYYIATLVFQLRHSPEQRSSIPVYLSESPRNQLMLPLSSRDSLVVLRAGLPPALFLMSKVISVFVLVCVSSQPSHASAVISRFSCSFKSWPAASSFFNEQVPLCLCNYLSLLLVISCFHSHLVLLLKF